MKKFSLIAIAIVLHCAFAFVESSTDFCLGKETCSDCIQTNNCAWCQENEFTFSERCFNRDNLKKCPKISIVDPRNNLTILQDDPLTEKKTGEASRRKEKIVQIKPQKVNLKLRPEEKYTMTVEYTQADDYPVDLYYLMDLSNSMKDDKEKLATLGSSLAKEMRKLTSNFRLGYGSFVDKVLLPYTSTTKERLENPCFGASEKCEPPYGYKHHMNLSEDAVLFEKSVRESKVSGNLDSPEGGFDAIVQAIVCKDVIGWRREARKLLVMSTDDTFHYAGDGKLAGLIEPNDGLCHMEDNEYTFSSVQDYPSIPQINSIVKKHSVNIIFAVTKTHERMYNDLAKLVEGSSTGTLSSDSSNVVSLISDEYKKIRSAIELKDDAPESLFRLTYHSKCRGDEREQTSKCEGLKGGDKVSFDVEIILKSCPVDPKQRSRTITIRPVGVAEALVITVDMICSCECNDASKPNICQNGGKLDCGICKCGGSYSGRKCECKEFDSSGVDSCKSPNATETCSGRGNCKCNVCQCNQRPNSEEIISGEFCECDNFSCKRHDSIVCSGPDHGKCDCGRCKCQDGWKGAACECSTNIETCRAPNGDICSGNGECDCGKCVCDKKTEEKGISYSGKFCDTCPSCTGHRCDEIKPCIECKVHKKGPYVDDCATRCSKFIINEVDELDDSEDEQSCSPYDEDDCRSFYRYIEIPNKNKTVTVIVNAKKSLDCPEKVSLEIIGASVVGAIVLIGLATLLFWKCIVTFHDRREFARFEKEKLLAQWDTGENPLYKEATSTFRNPMFSDK